LRAIVSSNTTIASLPTSVRPHRLARVEQQASDQRFDDERESGAAGIATNSSAQREPAACRYRNAVRHRRAGRIQVRQCRLRR